MCLKNAYLKTIFEHLASGCKQSGFLCAACEISGQTWIMGSLNMFERLYIHDSRSFMFMFPCVWHVHVHPPNQIGIKLAAQLTTHTLKGH